ncbi:MAG: DUF896 domain-containing protein [Ruminococcus sp.]|nr:DUF896 domain-containing protein [Ruminococcus sp.]
MNQEKINRINQLAKKAKSTGLTPEEKKEQDALRMEYRQSVIGNLRGQLDNTVIIEPDGSKRYPKDKKSKS